MKFEKKKLSNGMVILYEARELPLVSLSITNRFGSAHETSNVKGIAHFMEHLVFTGTKTRSHETISREIERRGGILNAFTNECVTSFWFKLPSEHIFIGLDILTDILKNPVFDSKKFEKEKRVILEEIKMYHDTPQSHVYEKITENLYEKPFGEGVIGSEKTVGALNRDFVADYFKKNYNPENYVATIVGKADFSAVCAYLEKEFKKTGGKMAPVQPIKKKNGESVEEREGIDQAHFLWGIHAPLAGEKKLAALEVLDAYLTGGMSSKLFLAIREERGLAYTVRGIIDAKKDYSNYTIYVGTRKEAIPEVKKLILEGFRKAQEMTLEELKQTKEKLIGSYKVAAEESTAVMNELMFAEFSTKAEDYYAYEKRIQEVSLEEVKNLAKIKEYSSAAIVPKG
jgi:predicted Zn-dependent peptidase